MTIFISLFLVAAITAVGWIALRKLKRHLEGTEFSEAAKSTDVAGTSRFDISSDNGGGGSGPPSTASSAAVGLEERQNENPLVESVFTHDSMLRDQIQSGHGDNLVALDTSLRDATGSQPNVSATADVAEQTPTSPHSDDGQRSRCEEDLSRSTSDQTSPLQVPAVELMAASSGDSVLVLPTDAAGIVAGTETIPTVQDTTSPAGNISKDQTTTYVPTEPVPSTAEASDNLRATQTEEEEPSAQSGSADLSLSPALIQAASQVPIPQSFQQAPSSQQSNDSVESVDTLSTEHVHEVPRKASKYRPPTQTPPRPRVAESQSRDMVPRRQPLELRVNALLDQHGYCTFRILARRPPAFSGELEVRQDQKRVVFAECSEDWYEVEARQYMGSWLSGVLFTESPKLESAISWQLSSRDVHVLAAQPGFGGPTSTTRLCIGRKHLVLCSRARVDEVSSVLAESGCGLISPSGEEMGAPTGWVFFWPVIPSQPVPLAAEDEILNVLRPQPELELVLEGGLWLQDSNWLVGWPPTIRVNGVVSPGEPVYIDRKPAVQDATGSYIAPGYVDPGPHLVACAGKTRSYSIFEPKMDWERWDAHNFGQGTICGASSVVHEQLIVTVPTSNPVLIGAVPGQVFRCPSAVGREWTGFVPFRVVWALPDYPLHCDRASSRIISVNRTDPRGIGSRSRRPHQGDSPEWRWCQFIRDCQRKRLVVSPSGDEVSALWRTYAVLASAVWRNRKSRGR